ncbi:SusC/RagA family TonB-linked outer membrane protein [Niastella sp. OAS944]|uniref:SusC/RagA family TonB-linked outer membrane protein n=1 Tax=Niastella sp. OAS944 TaxID=2664089 RepID=UPI0034878908|nr:TonB-linked SusC/RagA family outer membrane protein [Chitinophagaceae bacterium OAS944]
MKLTCPARTRWIAALCCLLSTMYGAHAQAPISHADLSKQVPVIPLNEDAITYINKEVRGTVTDSAGSPMPGVSVFVKTQTTIGTTTDLNGKYILSVPDDIVLVFTMVGFDNQEIPVKGKEVINISMKRASNSLNDVVVVAYGKQKKRDIIGSVTTISPEELKVPSSNLTTALAGRLAGVIAYQTTGEPGQDNAQFFIRGVTTFGYKTSPLILIDGVEYTATDLARIQPDDIASFSIMKDATASALYGARGANGVILVTTKEGKQGKAKVYLRFENSISQPTKTVKLADPITYLKLHQESVLTRNPLAPLPYSQSKIDYTQLGVNPDMFPAVDWMNMLFKDRASNRRGNFSVSGGGQIVNYFLAGSFMQDNGILKVDKRNNFNNNINLKTYNLRSNVGLKVTRTTDVMVRLYGTFDDYNGPVDGGTGLYRKVMRTSPVLFPAYYPADSAHQFVNHIMFGNFDKGNYLNPYADMVSGYKDYNKSLMSAQFEVRQDLSFVTPGLAARAFTNINRSSYFDVSRSYNPFYYTANGYDKYTNTYQLQVINPDQVGAGVVPQGGTDYLGAPVGAEKTVTSNFYFEGATNYNRTFDKHGLSGLLVVTARSKQEGDTKTLQKSLPYRNMGVSGRATYSFDSRYYAEFNFGYNGSERFYKSERFGFFPSVGMAWYVSNEKFFEQYKSAINKLKLRATYGLVGNDEIGSADDRFYYLSDVNLNAGSTTAFGTDGRYTRNTIAINRYENRDITWETSRKANYAMELSLFGKWDIIAEYYTEKRSNILMGRTYIPYTLGLQVNLDDNPPKANVGEASGHGVDISVEYLQNFGKNLLIQARGNFTYARSRLDKNESLQYGEDLYYLNRIGHPIPQTWGYIAERLFVDDEEVKNSPTQTFGDYKGGDIKYRDVNQDGVVDKLDMVPIGFPTTPEITYGFGVSAKYKGLDISTFFQGTARRSFWMDVKATAPFVSYRYKSDELPGYILQNQLLQAYADDHWSEEKRNLYALWPRLSPVLNGNNSQTSTWFMRSGAFLRLKQVELGYTVPKKLTTKIHIENVRVYANGSNLFNFSDFKLWDVELAGNGLNYPIQRVVNMGIQVSL